MAKPFANSGDPDQDAAFCGSDLGLHCLPITPLGSPDYNGLKLYLNYAIIKRRKYVFSLNIFSCSK